MDDLSYDADLVYFYQGRPVTAVVYDGDPEEGYAETEFRDGLQNGKSVITEAAGSVSEVAWYRQGMLHGINRKFRADGTLESATGYEYGVPIWVIQFEVDGATVARSSRPPLTESLEKHLDYCRRTYAFPPVRPESDAPRLDLN